MNGPRRTDTYVRAHLVSQFLDRRAGIAPPAQEPAPAPRVPVVEASALTPWVAARWPQMTREAMRLWLSWAAPEKLAAFDAGTLVERGPR